MNINPTLDMQSIAAARRLQELVASRGKHALLGLPTDVMRWPSDAEIRTAMADAQRERARAFTVMVTAPFRALAAAARWFLRRRRIAEVERELRAMPAHLLADIGIEESRIAEVARSLAAGPNRGA